jgi:ADP-ribosylglycohydrolase
MFDDLQVDKIVGCIIGGAIGDALGLPYEGEKEPKIKPVRFLEISDDTQMTLATCEAISRTRQIDPSQIAKTFADWFIKKKISYVGASTYKALQELSFGGHWALVGRKGEMSAGNGAAMRIAPLAFCLNPDEERGKLLIRDVSRITHHNEEAYIGALAIVIAIYAAYKGYWLGEPTLIKYVMEKLPDSSVRDRLIEVSKLEKKLSLKAVSEKFGCSGYVVETVPLVLYAAEQISYIGFEALLNNLIELGGDTDTNSSIFGQILGTFLGYKNLPEFLISSLPDIDLLISVAKRFAASRILIS